MVMVKWNFISRIREVLSKYCQIYSLYIVTNMTDDKLSICSQMIVQK